MNFDDPILDFIIFGRIMLKGYYNIDKISF